jgi:hypothetical protein
MTDSPGSLEAIEGQDRVTPVRRQWVVDVLCEAYAEDQIGVHELESRLDDANRARFESELAPLVSDLILPDAGKLSAEGGIGPLQKADSLHVPERQLSVGFWSGRVRKGSWVPAHRITAVALQGGVELDFREAAFGPGIVEGRAFAVMGGIQVIVPPDLRVEASGFAIMGGFEERTESHSGGDVGGPLLKIRGFALMGAIQIDVRLPGETSREAKSRRRKERRARAG